jgi:hypothetical protein
MYSCKNVFLDVALEVRCHGANAAALREETSQFVVADCSALCLPEQESPNYHRHLLVQNRHQSTASVLHGLFEVA